MGIDEAPAVIGRRTFPCCGGRARIAFGPGRLRRRCPACRRVFEVGFEPAPYASGRLGAPVVAICWTRVVRRGVAGRPVAGTSDGQLGFDL